MTRLLFAALLVLVGPGFARSAPVPKAASDPLPKGATARLGSALYMEPGYLDLTFSTDGKRLLTRNTQGVDRDDKQSLTAIDAETGVRVPTRLTAPAGLDKFPSVNSVLASDRVVWLASAPPDRPLTPEAVVTDLDGKVLSRFEVGGRPMFVVEHFRNGFARAAVSLDGRHLAVVTTESPAVALYALDSGKLLLSVSVGAKDRSQVSFAQDNATLFLKQEGKPIRRYAIATGKELPPLAGTDGEVRQVAVSPNGKWVVTGKFRTQTVVDGKPSYSYATALEVRDGATGKPAGRLDVGSTTPDFAFAGNDALLVSAHKAPLGSVLARWNVATLTRQWEVEGQVGRLAVAPNGKQVASGSRRLGLYDVETGRLLNEPRGHSWPIEWLTFAPDGKAVDTFAWGEFITWGLDGERKHRAHVPEPRSRLVDRRFGAGSQFVWTGSAGVPVDTTYGWDREKRAIGWAVGAARAGEPVVSPDGKHLVRFRLEPNKPAAATVYIVSSGEKVREWAFARHESDSLREHGPQPFFGDGRFVLAENGETVVALDVLTGREAVRVKRELVKPLAKAGAPQRVALSANGERLVVIDPTLKQIEVYDTKTGKQAMKQDYPGEGWGRGILSPDGTHLVLWPSSQNAPKELTVWNLSGDPRPRKLAAPSPATCAAFSPDGKSLAVGYTDGTALLWDMTAK